MKTNWIRKALNGVSLTTAMFIFQACYGTPQDIGLDVRIEGQVKSKLTGLPIKGIRVSVKDGIQYQITDDEGRFLFYTEWANQLSIIFEDIDGPENGNFQNVDTLVGNIQDVNTLNINLEEK